MASLTVEAGAGLYSLCGTGSVFCKKIRCLSRKYNLVRFRKELLSSSYSKYFVYKLSFPLQNNEPCLGEGGGGRDDGGEARARGQEEGGRQQGPVVAGERGGLHDTEPLIGSQLSPLASHWLSTIMRSGSVLAPGK